MTCESMPVIKKVGDIVIGSTFNGDGAIEFRATKVGDETVLAQIVEMVKKAQPSHAPIQNLTDRISGIFVPTVLIIAIITFVVWYVFLGATAVNAMLFAVAVIVIACPCALGLATPTALMVGTSRAAKMGVLIKDGQALEEINAVKIIAFDKTGTITVGKPTVTDVVGEQTKTLQVAGSLEASSEHPLAKAIVEKTHQERIKLLQVTDFKAVEGQGVTANLDGQPAFVGSLKLAENEQLTEKLKEQAGVHSGVVSTVLDAVADAIAVDDEEVPVYTSGATNIFKYPELADSSKASELISAFEDKQELVEMIKDTVSDSGENTGIQVYIGNESPIQTMKDCSVVTASYDLGEGMKGTIGIIGPKRMDYENVVDNLKTLKVQLDNIFKKP